MSEEHKTQLTDYLSLIDNKIRAILSRPEKECLTYDILDTPKVLHQKKVSLKEKHRLMKIGEIWQEVLGNYNGFMNLHKGHESGLDIISHTKKIVVEIKNRTNTDNHSAKKYNIKKLVNFKKKNPDYMCIYANINAESKHKTLKGCRKDIICEGVEIKQMVGYEFLMLILGDDTDFIIENVKRIIDNYT